MANMRLQVHVCRHCAALKLHTRHMQYEVSILMVRVLSHRAP